MAFENNSKGKDYKAFLKFSNEYSDLQRQRYGWGWKNFGTRGLMPPGYGHLGNQWNHRFFKYSFKAVISTPPKEIRKSSQKSYRAKCKQVLNKAIREDDFDNLIFPLEPDDGWWY